MIDTMLLENARVRAKKLGHILSSFRPYKSNDDKMTAYCHVCGKFAIVYMAPQSDGDQSRGDALAFECEPRRRTE